MRLISALCVSLPRQVLFAQGMKETTDHSKAELATKTAALEEQTSLMRAVGSAVGGVCRDGRLPQHAKNLLANGQFSFQDDGKPTQARYWAPFGKGYVLDSSAGRIRREEGADYSADARTSNLHSASEGLYFSSLLNWAVLSAVSLLNVTSWCR